MNYLLYTDGACSGNPGPGGWACIVANCKTNFVFESGGRATSTTNNRMELQATIEGLKVILQTHKLAESIHLCLFSDSVYVIKGATQWMSAWKKRNWQTTEGKPVSNQDLWVAMDDLLGIYNKNKSKVEWRYTRGHQGIPGNERCDHIAVCFAKAQEVSLYNGSWSDYFFDLRQIPEFVPVPQSQSGGSAPKTKAYYISYVDQDFKQHTTWGECWARVQGRSNARYKKIESETELNDTLKKWGLK